MIVILAKDKEDFVLQVKESGAKVPIARRSIYPCIANLMGGNFFGDEIIASQEFMEKHIGKEFDYPLE